MRLSRGLVLGLTLLGVVGFSIVQGQKGDPARPVKGALDPKVVMVRLLLGTGGGTAEDWGGKVSVDKGEVVGVEGWRFRQDDRIDGPSAWEASTRVAKKAVAK